MNKKTKFLLSLVLSAAVLGESAALAVGLTVGGESVPGAELIGGTTYAPLRAVSETLCAGAEVSWDGESAYVSASGLYLVCRPGEDYISANGRALYVPDGVKLINGLTLVPVRVLAKAFGCEVGWDGERAVASMGVSRGYIESGSRFYSSDEVYWLSRIIEAESGGEPFDGKIAVGETVLNRVKSSDFPDTIYGVIFDDEWGVQYQPVSNGAIYNTPSADSVLAAKLCLDGAEITGGALFFLNPEKATNLWIVENREYIMSIGGHDFYA